jgi:hypothetical protein
MRNGQWCTVDGQVGIFIRGEGVHLVDPKTGETLMSGPRQTRIVDAAKAVPLGDMKLIPKSRRPK